MSWMMKIGLSVTIAQARRERWAQRLRWWGGSYGANERIPFPQRESVTRKCCKNTQGFQCFLLAASQPRSLPFQMWLLFHSFPVGFCWQSILFFGWLAVIASDKPLERGSFSIRVKRPWENSPTLRPEFTSCNRAALTGKPVWCSGPEISRGTSAAYQELERCCDFSSYCDWNLFSLFIQSVVGYLELSTSSPFSSRYMDAQSSHSHFLFCTVSQSND